jgi:hypothetical protein
MHFLFFRSDLSNCICEIKILTVSLSSFTCSAYTAIYGPLSVETELVEVVTAATSCLV